MNFSAHISSIVPIINAIKKPFPRHTIGYVAAIQKLCLEIPYPLILTMVAEKNRILKKRYGEFYP